MEYKILFYVLLFCNILQFSLAYSKKTSEPKQKLLDFYERELNNISKEFCEKAKNISEYILKDKKIQWANSHELQEFKKNITDFLNKYESLARYGLYEELAILFDDTTQQYFDEDEEELNHFSTDGIFIKNLLDKLGWIQLDDDYEQKYNELIVKKLNKKFKEFKSQLNAKELKQEQTFIKWFEELQMCKNYSCQYDAFADLFDTRRSLLEDYIQASIEDIYIDYCDKAVNISYKILKDFALSQTNSPIIRAFKRNITNFIEKFNSNKDANKVMYIAELYANTTKYYLEIPKDKLNSDMLLIAATLWKYGSDKLEEEYEEKFDDLVYEKLYEKFADLKRQLYKEATQKIKPLLDWYDELDPRKKSMAVALEKLYAL